MSQLLDPVALASKMDGEIRQLPHPSTATIRSILRNYSLNIKEAEPKLVLEFSRQLLTKVGRRWIAYEIIANHRPAFCNLNQEMIEQLGTGIDSWWTVDSFARTISGPAWRDGLVSDRLIFNWANSSDRW